MRRVAVGNGSAGSLVPDALRAADVLVAGEVRYHDALSAVAGGLSIIEAGHDATEWPLVGILARLIRESGIEVIEEPAATGWWTMEADDDRR